MFIDVALLGALTGLPVRHRWREPDEPASVPEAHALVVAPATFNCVELQPIWRWYWVTRARLALPQMVPMGMVSRLWQVG